MRYAFGVQPDAQGAHKQWIDDDGKGGEDGILLRLACLGVGVRLVLAKEAGLGPVRGDRADGLRRSCS